MRQTGGARGLALSAPASVSERHSARSQLPHHRHQTSPSTGQSSTLSQPAPSTVAVSLRHENNWTVKMINERNDTY